MNIRSLQYFISIICIILTSIHIVFPALSIDAITLGLIILAVIPWLSPIFKSVELPGVLKIEFQEFLKTEKKAQEAGLLAPMESEANEKKYSYQLIQKSDPNLALAGLRLEIETRLRRIADEHSIPNMDQSIYLVLKKLISEKIFEKNEGQVIQELLRLLNSAVHGAQVEPLTFEWANDVGPRILYALDQH